MTEANLVETSNDIISQINYEETNPVYQRIKKEFTDKLKDKYECTDYDVIVNYVFDFVFKKKLDKAKCIEKLDPYFNNKAADILNYLWKITKEFEIEQKRKVLIRIIIIKKAENLIMKNIIKIINKNIIKEKEKEKDREVIAEEEAKICTKITRIFQCNRKDFILLKDLMVLL